MLLILSKDFTKNRDTVRQGILALIQETIDNINKQRVDKNKPEEEIVAALNEDKFPWGKYNKKHRVAVLFKSTPNPQWYYSADAGMFIVECYYPEKVVTWAEGYPEFYYAMEIALNFDYYKDLCERAKDINYQIVRTKDDPLFQKVVNDKNIKLLGCDIETRGFSWKKDKMLVHGFAYEDNAVMIIPQHELEKDPEFLAQFKTFVEDPEKIFVWQNGKFDTKFYRYAGWNARVDEDTLLQSYALDERGRRHGLEYQATKILNTDGYKHKIKFETVSPEDPDLHYYLAQDCIYTRLIHKHHNMMMNKPENAHSYKLYKTILLKASWALLRLEENGFFVRKDYTLALEKDWGTKLNNAENTLIQLANVAGFTPQGFVAWSGQKAMPDQFKCGAPKQLAYVLIGLLGLPKYKGKISTDADTMLHWLFNTLDFPIKNEYEYEDASEETVNNWVESTLVEKTKNAKRFLWSLISYRKLKKMYSTYITNAVEYSQEDGRVHVTYKIQGTVTGRLSSGDPMNLQNIPRRKDIKCIFGAPEGKTLIECDYSQCIRKGTKVYSTDMNIEDHPDAIYKGEAPIFELRTDSGFVVHCTNDHRIMTGRGWVEAQNILEGDTVQVQDPTTKILYWDAFKSFTNLNIVDSVYDLMDQPETRFIANGVVVHNCELRVLAYLSQDPDMLETYANDGDLHDTVATKMFGPNFNKEQRVGAKTVNFGQ